MFFESVTYNNDLAPFQGASAGWAVPRVETWLKPWAKWHEVKASLGSFLFYCPGGAEEFSPGFQPWETSNKAVRPERARDGVGEMPFEC